MSVSIRISICCCCCVLTGGFCLLAAGSWSGLLCQNPFSLFFPCALPPCAAGVGGFLGDEPPDEKYMGEKYVQEEFLGEESLGKKYMGEKYVQEDFLGEESLGEKYMGEKYMGRKICARRVSG